ncbi:unnamed protein product [Albugo candida]|uniref:Uncharacterized protein n=1 Tax=Albugo candida TaxID=65357 RepID=A0A024GA13_9STRA|nr:unnamed protein product [Albugo candida]|eukprot:CCI43603.1 unnamed protein product [Albugo candida]
MLSAIKGETRKKKNGAYIQRRCTWSSRETLSAKGYIFDVYHQKKIWKSLMNDGKFFPFVRLLTLRFYKMFLICDQNSFQQCRKKNSHMKLCAFCRYSDHTENLINRIDHIYQALQLTLQTTLSRY